MSLDKSYTGSVEEIVKALNAKHISHHAESLFEEAVREKNGNLIAALVQTTQYNKHLKNSFFLYLSFAEIKSSFDFLITHLPLNIFLEDILKKQAVQLNDISLQKEIVTLLLNLGDTLKYDTQVGLDILFTHKDVFLDHLASSSKDTFLKLLFRTDAYSDESIKLQRDLIDLALNRGADIIAAVKSSSPSLEFLAAHKEMLLNHLLNPLSTEAFLELVFRRYSSSDESIKLQSDLLEFAINKGANITVAMEGLRPSIKFLAAHKEILLNNTNNSLSADSFLKLALQQNPAEYTGDDYFINTEKLKLIYELVDTALSQGANINNISVSEFYNLNPVTISACKELFVNAPKPLSTEDLLRMAIQSLFTRTFVNGREVIKIDEIKAREEIFNYAIEIGVNVNAKSELEDKDKEYNSTILETLFIHHQFELIDKILTPDLVIGTLSWITVITDNIRIDCLVEAIKRFPNSFDADSVYEVVRVHGASESKAQNIIDVYNLAKDYASGISLSDTEISLLDSSNNTISVEELKDIEIKNQYGFTPLQLAVLGHKIDLAIQMIEDGHSLTEKSASGLTALELASQLEHDSKFTEVLFKHLDDIDIILNEFGESLVDNFISNEEFKDEILDRTKDPLFNFFKKDADLFAPSKQPEVTHIAISHGEGFWSSGLWSWSRLATKEHPNVKFHLVTLNHIQKGGDPFIKQFDGWMNPGGGDDYPRDKQEFSKADWQSEMILIETYQTALDKTLEYKIPYTGMCAGAQNLVLNHNGYLQPVKGYHGGGHTISYLKGTLSHFMAMTKAEQKTALDQCEFSDIAFKGMTAHGYAGVVGKLGEGIELGAISEGGVAMSYGHENGFRYATQFHPEGFYKRGSAGVINYQKSWLDNFIHQANMHHDFRIGQNSHPEVFFQYISERLKQCTSTPTCLAEDTLLFENAAMESAFFGIIHNDDTISTWYST